MALIGSRMQKKKTIFSGEPLKWMHESIYFRRKDSGWFIQKFELPPNSIFNTWIFFNSSPLSPYVILISSPHTPLSLTPGRESGGGWRLRGEGDEGRRQQRPAGAQRRWRGPGCVAMVVPRPDLAVAAGGARPQRRQRRLLTGGAW